MKGIWMIKVKIRVLINIENQNRGEMEKKIWESKITYQIQQFFL
jgi:hypothetical protein